MTSSLSSNPRTVRQYQQHVINPEAVREAKRQQMEFCSNQNVTLPKGASKIDISAGLVVPNSPGFAIHVHGLDALGIEARKHGSWELNITKNIATFMETFSDQVHGEKGVNNKENGANIIGFVDIGANVGWYTLNMAALGYHVIAFEPMEANQQLLRTSICMLPVEMQDRITLFGHGLSDQEQTCFQYSKLFNQGNGITKCVSNPDEFKVPDSFIDRGRVKLKRLDSIIRSISSTTVATNDASVLSIGAMKIDTEGFEPIIFRGGDAFLKSGVPRIFCEFAPHRVETVSPNLKGTDYLGMFYDAKYKVQKEREGPLLSRKEAMATKWPHEMDITLVHDESVF